MRTMIAVILTGLCLAGCQAGPEQRDYTEYQKPSPLLEQEIRDRVAALEFESGTTLVHNQRRLVYIGDPAIPFLLTGLRHTSRLVRGSCAYVLGGIRDLRTLSDLRDVAEDDDVAEVRYEAAAALVAIGDKKHGIPVLIEGMEDQDIRCRYKCFEVLRQQTALTFGYAHDGDAASRAAAVEKWKAWAAKTFK